MQDQRTSDALARIERALSRVETHVSAKPAPAAESAETERLRKAHELLRSRVTDAIGEIDRMLEAR
jgi:hypothetical protein